MRYVPIVPHFDPHPAEAEMKKVNSLAERLLLEHSEFQIPSIFQHLVPSSLHQAASIHVDDLSGIARLHLRDTIAHYQDRARLRAGDGDVVLTCGEPPSGYEEYCESFLGLGRPQWLRPQYHTNQLRVAEAAWEDRSVRRDLVRAIRRGGVEYLHPHMGTLPVWELALLLTSASHRPVQVIAPLPALTRWVNDKVAFTSLVTRLFGGEVAPETDSAWNESTLVIKLKSMAEHCRYVGVKLPNSAGGEGNFVFNSTELRGKTSAEVKTLIRATLPDQFELTAPLLIDAWRTDTLCSPSSQMWIPPLGDGSPLVEGVFVQATIGAEGTFVGNQPAELPDAITNSIVEKSWMLASVLQRLGYLGRCSFDLILVGESLDNCHLEFIECNGRWGGTSLPMTLMNRLFGDWKKRPFAAHDVEVSGLDALEFSELLDVVSHELFDVRTGDGNLVLYSPQKLKRYSAVDAVWLGNSCKDAASHLSNQLPSLLDRYLHQSAAPRP